ncbi:hypothetical protein BN863_17830 [Formosa agariphila KMM 3901]|uniref:Uncharacterized protein n=1 Tax=Formosa agariphila (strain DSM 15362 / KCTC 12365 / LMG 23005 / KMM 3901 / M-2Alg 35-1) TaxID=1347342 RepID=T2KL81_FORAG|nr:hypothetical protein [Formosa agariphila]CDF79495.1 hypothetical protein BN863_17830 [Formosa agariphila KMM 3901]
MKYAEFDIDNNKIEFLNSVLGFEIVLINGKKISNRFSITGIEHKFELNSKNYILKSKAKLFAKDGINIQLSENRELIETINLEYNKKHRLYWMLFGVFFGLLGFKLGKILVENLTH